MVLVDTSVWIDLLAGRETEEVGLLREVSAHQPVTTGDIMVCEVLQGIRSPREFDLAAEVLLALSPVTIGGVATALAAAANYRTLRRRGVTIRGTIDCLIATYCIENGHALLHSDRDFRPFEEHLGLRVPRG